VSGLYHIDDNTTFKIQKNINSCVPASDETKIVGAKTKTKTEAAAFKNMTQDNKPQDYDSEKSISKLSQDFPSL